MKIKDKIIKILNGNYEDFISIRNRTADKFSFIKIESLEQDGNNIIFLFQDGSFITKAKTTFLRWFISLSAMDGLAVGDTIRESLCNKLTYTIRKECSDRGITLSYNSYLGTTGIFLGIALNTNYLFTRIYRDSTNSIELDKKFFSKTVPIVEQNNTDRIKELLSVDKTPKEKIKEGLMRAAALPFIEDLRFKDGRIYFAFKPYQLDLGNGFRVNMPKLKMRFHVNDRKFLLDDDSYRHPHISTGFVCLGSFQNVINSTRWNFDIALITMYEHACTYNKVSPFSNTRPIIERSTNYFYSKCTFEYLGITYTYDEFLTFLSASFDNRNEFYITLMGNNSSESERKQYLNINN